jgi:hypothetical protein
MPSLIRILQTTQVTVSHTFKVDEQATDAAGTVTATLKRLDGTAYASGNATHGATGVYTFVVPPSALLDTLTLDWAGSVGGTAVTVRDFVEVVGGFYFDLATARIQLSLSGTDWPVSALADKRTQVEQECDAITYRSFVPRFTRVALSGNDTPYLGTPHGQLRTLRAVTVSGTAWSPADVAAVGLGEAMLVRDSGAIWPRGTRNIVAEYEYGEDYPPLEISDKAILRLRSTVSAGKSTVPERALSFSIADGGVYRISTPSRQRTGIPDIDAVYERYTRQRRAVIA